MRLFDRMTILVIPTRGPGWLSLQVPGGVVPLVCVLFLAGVIGLGTCAFQYAGHVRSVATIERLETEKNTLDREVALMRDTVDRLGGDLERLAEFEREIRTVSGMPEIDPHVASAGIGGPAPLLCVDGAVPAGGGEFGLDRERVESLLRQARFRRACLSQVAQVLTHRKETLGRMPTILPVADGRVTSHFGKRIDPFTGVEACHEGLDISAARGSNVVATAAGRVVCAERQSGLGLAVEIDHQNGLKTVYGHNSRIFVTPGQWVERGETIAAVGSTGRATSPHCHYEVHEEGVAVNPSRFILNPGIVYD
jgi:murein DD-endopeptidase MepM/ murein hydrolase activator NlpD